MAGGCKRGGKRRARSWVSLVAAVAAAGAALTESAPAAQAAPATQAAPAVQAAPSAQAAPAAPFRINGGVEDGTFSSHCLTGTTKSPDLNVLNAVNYRKGLRGPGDTVVRILVPYNIAKQKAKLNCLNAYLQRAHQVGATVEVSLNRLGAKTAAPSVTAYAKAVNKLKNDPDSAFISYLTAWNEPNNTSYLKASSREQAASLAAQYFNTAAQAFGDGRMVAGDFDSGVGPQFLDTYADAVQGNPGIWAIHPYTDETNFQYYMWAGLSPQQAGARAYGTSKVRELALELHSKGYGSSTQLWINEIYVDHKADKKPPKGPPKKLKKGSKGKKPTTFSITNQANGALFISGGLGSSSLPGGLQGTGLPQLTRYIYLRAWDNGMSTQKPRADVLNVNAPSACIYATLASGAGAPAAGC